MQGLIMEGEDPPTQDPGTEEPRGGEPGEGEEYGGNTHPNLAQRDYGMYDEIPWYERVSMVKQVVRDSKERLGHGLDPGAVMIELTEALHEALPKGLRHKLPWATFVNMYDETFREAGWTFVGGRTSNGDRERSIPPQEYARLVETVLNKFERFMPEGQMKPSTIGPSTNESQQDEGDLHYKVRRNTQISASRGGTNQ
jgi:hypothetical protein